MWDGNVIPGRACPGDRAAGGRLRSASGRPAGRSRLAPQPPCYLTGTPIRDVAGGIDRASARAQLDIGPDDRVLLIFGGSQAVMRFNKAVAEALPRLVDRVRVLHVTGDAGYEGAMATRDTLPAAKRERYRPERFLGEEMTAALAAADLVVGRAGSSTLAEVAAYGLPMIVVPYPHAAGHQRRNAEEMVRAGAARLVEDGDFDADALLAAAAILDDPRQQAAMAAAARSLARPGAGAAVAELVMAAAERRPFPAAAEIEALARGAAARGAAR